MTTVFEIAVTIHLKKIITSQKKAIRIITFSEINGHSNSLFKKLNILKFVDLVQFFELLWKILLEVSRCLNLE